MSDREKKLVFLFGLAAFVLLNVFAITWFKGQKSKLAADLTKAELKVEGAIETRDRFDEVVDEMAWLADHTPEPRAGQIVATELEQYASNQAQTHQLTVKRRSIMPNDETGTYFHSAKVEFNVSGKEDSLYRWLDRLRMPDQLRAVTFMRMAPDAKDDTLIDCTIHAEQWYIPPSGAPGEEAEPLPEAEPEASPAPDSPIPGLPPGIVKPPGTE